MTRCQFVIVAHLVTAILLVVLLIKGPEALFWSTLGFSGLTGIRIESYVLDRGPLGKPGPKLMWALRPVHRFRHRLLYIAVASAAAASVTVIDATVTGHALTVLFFLGLLHGIFYFWPHTAQFDDASRSVLPKAMHGLL